MNYPCPVLADTNRYEVEEDLRANNWAINGPEFTREQLLLVEKTAREIVTIGKKKVRHKVVTDPVTNLYHAIDVIEIYDFSCVHERLQDRLTAEMTFAIYLGDAQAIADMQELIGECAQEVAFEYLSLASNPFLDWEDLKSEAEKFGMFR